MKKIAIIGYGVVGGGITAVLEANAAKIERAVGEGVEVGYILDLRDFPDSPYADRVVHDIQPILDDPDVVLVCETMGGSHPALEFSLACMKAGKSVVTSNKEVVANFGDKLLECAAECGVTYMFEAAVGGGIPVIRPFYTSLAGEKISAVAGILNGTTNFILSKMKSEGREFDDVLREAQMLGYAEANPAADVDGIDAKRKIIILTALSSRTLLSEDDVYAETMRNITPADISAAAKWGGAVKLIARCEIEDEAVKAYVCPMFVPNSNPLSHISDVYNGISVTSPTSGDIMFYGRGAGRFPTAGAVMADVVGVLSGAAKCETQPKFSREGAAVCSFSEIPFAYYIRSMANRTDMCDALSMSASDVTVLSDEGGVVEVIAGDMTQSELSRIMPNLGDVKSVIRILK